MDCPGFTDQVLLRGSLHGKQAEGQEKEEVQEGRTSSTSTSASSCSRCRGTTPASRSSFDASRNDLDARSVILHGGCTTAELHLCHASDYCYANDYRLHH